MNFSGIYLLKNSVTMRSFHALFVMKHEMIFWKPRFMSENRIQSTCFGKKEFDSVCGVLETVSVTFPWILWMSFVWVVTRKGLSILEESFYQNKMLPRADLVHNPFQKSRWKCRVENIGKRKWVNCYKSILLGIVFNCWGRKWNYFINFKSVHPSSLNNAAGMAVGLLVALLW